MRLQDGLRQAGAKASAFLLRGIEAMRGQQGERKTRPLPTIFTGYGGRGQGLPKPTPANLRRFAETPVARKAINTIKDRVAGMSWRIQPKNGRALADVADGARRIQLLTDNLDLPNPEDSFRSLIEQVLEDVLVGGFGAIEVQLSGDAERPLHLWPVDGATIRLRGDWDGEPDSPKYAQSTGRPGPEGTVPLNDDELMY